eukprot:scaffold1311_cov256-Pinguiococcus_pyrenoidosus.AAC.71
MLPRMLNTTWKSCTRAGSGTTACSKRLAPLRNLPAPQPRRTGLHLGRPDPSIQHGARKIGAICEIRHYALERGLREPRMEGDRRNPDETGQPFLLPGRQAASQAQRKENGRMGTPTNTRRGLCSTHGAEEQPPPWGKTCSWRQQGDSMSLQSAAEVSLPHEGGAGIRCETQACASQGPGRRQVRGVAFRSFASKNITIDRRHHRVVLF